MSLTITLCGQELQLRHDRSLYWPSRRTLLVADLHFGKADAFRAAAIPIPGNAHPTLAKLDHALDATDAERLIVLGDFWHDRSGRTPLLVAELEQWRDRRKTLHIDLVRGNHDRAGAPPPNWSIEWHAGPFLDAPFEFAHHPVVSEGGYVLAGHLHPGVMLTGRGRQRLRLPCFRFGPRVGVLPAFGALTGNSSEQPQEGERVFAVAGDAVIEVTTTVR